MAAYLNIDELETKPKHILSRKHAYMKPIDVVLLTESRYVNPTTVNHYTHNILTEDSLVQNALEANGLTVLRLDWADQNFDWTNTKLALFRTTWDYFNRISEFSRWLESASMKTKFVNDIELIRWNMDKHYLRDLQKSSINATPTVYIEQEERVTLKEIVSSSGWDEVVLKPCISGGGRHTYRFLKDRTNEYETVFQELIAVEAMMVQQFQRNVIGQGEIALMIIDGTFTHAILKKARDGEFRVQDDFGGSVHPHSPTKEEIAFAERVISVCQIPPLYARIDVVKDNDGNLSVIELELIEPEMWFRFNPSAAERLADAVRRRL